jgi:hypothetical protein
MPSKHTKLTNKKITCTFNFGLSGDKYIFKKEHGVRENEVTVAFFGAALAGARREQAVGAKVLHRRKGRVTLVKRVSSESSSQTQTELTT